MSMREVFDKIIGFVENYNQRASEAFKIGNGKLYVPGYMDLEDFLRILDRPSILVRVDPSDNSKEPAYLSFEEGLRGYDAEGSLHDGFIVIDILTHEIDAIINRDGEASFDSTKEVLQGVWESYTIKVENSRGEKFEIGTEGGMEGTATVTIVIDDENGQPIVVHDGNPVAIRNMTKVAASIHLVQRIK